MVRTPSSIRISVPGVEPWRLAREKLRQKLREHGLTVRESIASHEDDLADSGVEEAAG